MKAVISRLGWSGRGALAGRGLRKETVINLRSESNKTSVMAAKDQRHFTKGSGVDTMDIAGPKEERERLDAKKGKGPKIARKGKELLQSVLLLHPALQKRAKKVR